jgi:hypothetical protein
MSEYKNYIPYFDSMCAKEFYYLVGAKCCVVCHKPNTHKCAKKLCVYNFCEQHSNHLHHSCGAIGCKEYGSCAIDYKDINGAICVIHFEQWRNNPKMFYIDDKRKDKKCKQFCCVKSAKVSGYCDTHEAMWIHMKKQGYSGPFSSGWK